MYVQPSLYQSNSTTSVSKKEGHGRILGLFRLWPRAFSWPLLESSLGSGLGLDGKSYVEMLTGQEV